MAFHAAPYQLWFFNELETSSGPSLLHETRILEGPNIDPKSYESHRINVDPWIMVHLPTFTTNINDYINVSKYTIHGSCQIKHIPKSNIDEEKDMSLKSFDYSIAAVCVRTTTNQNVYASCLISKSFVSCLML